MQTKTKINSIPDPLIEAAKGVDGGVRRGGFSRLRVDGGVSEGTVSL